MEKICLFCQHPSPHYDIHQQMLFENHGTKTPRINERKKTCYRTYFKFLSGNFWSKLLLNFLSLDSPWHPPKPKKQQHNVLEATTTWMCQEFSKWLVNRLKPPYKWDILGWNNPLILTFDPNFQQDIQAQHTGRSRRGVWISGLLFSHKATRDVGR